MDVEIGDGFLAESAASPFEPATRGEGGWDPAAAADASAAQRAALPARETHPLMSPLKSGRVTGVPEAVEGVANADPVVAVVDQIDFADQTVECLVELHTYESLD